MKPVELKISGLNSFQQEETIDFLKLTEKGLFGIFGPTGSGKSSILDAITLALYGSVARKSTSYINTYKDKLYISFEFEAGSGSSRRNYAIERSMKRTKTGGVNTAFAKLIRYNQLGIEEKIIEKVSEIKKEVEENVIGLNFDDFIKTVVLPQGQFSEFLTLTGSQRNDMLERILGLEEYGKELNDKIKRKKDLVKEELNKLSGELSRYGNVSEESIKELQKNEKELLDKENILKKQIEELNKDYEKYKRVWELQGQLAIYEVEQETLLKNKKNMKEKEIKLVKGRNAATVKPYIDSLYSSEKDIDEYTEKLKKCKELFETLSMETKTKEEEYKFVYDRKEEEIPNQKQKLKEVQDAITLEEETNKLEIERNKLKEQDKKIKGTLEDLGGKLEQIVKDKETIEKEINSKEKYVDENTVLPEYRSKIAEGSRLEEVCRESQESIKEKKLTLENILKEIENLEKEQKILEEKIKIKNNSLESLTKESEKLLNAKPDDDNARVKLVQDINNITNEIDKVKEYVLKSNQLQDLEKEFSENKDKNDKQLKQTIEELNLKEELLKSTSKELEELKYKNLASLLSKELNENDKCPVCGSKEHPNLAVKVSEEEIENKQSEQEKIELEVKQLTDTKNKLQLTIENLIKEIKNNNLEIETLKEKIGVRTLDKLGLEQKNLQDKYNKSQKYSEEWSTKNESINLKLQEVSKEKHELDNTNTRYLTKIESSVKNKENIEEDIKKLEAKYKESLEEYTEIKEKLSIENFIEKSKEINEIDKKLRDISKALTKQRNDQRELEANKAQIEENINKYKNELVKLEQNITSKDEIIKQSEEKIQKISLGKELNLLKEEIEKQIEDLLEKENKLKEELEILKERLDKGKEIIVETEAKKSSAEKSLKDTNEKLEKSLKENEFNSIKEAKESFIDRLELQEIDNEIKAYKEKLSVLNSNIEKIKNQLENRKITEGEWNKLTKEREDKVNNNNELQEEKGKIKEQINEMVKNLESMKDIKLKFKKFEKQDDILQNMASLIKGKAFIKYISRSHLKMISKIATSKLKEITRERYQLEIDEDNNFIIVDNHNGGVKRECSSLSGGETFLVSLSLALALSTKIQLKGKSSIEFFFLDEGFGTLDPETLDLAMNSLEKLRNEKLSVGIISHVEELKNRVPVKLIVSPPEVGSSGSKVDIRLS